MAASSRPHLPPRAIIALSTGKLLGQASRRFGRGGGTALPGAVADRIDARLTARLAGQLGAGRVVVTGTNGKTTTTRMLAGIAEQAGLRPVHNRSGSNLMRGIGTTLLEAAGFNGRIPDGARRAAVIEVDEATLPHAVPALRPGVAVFTNLFRDQLDRYGELDSILTLWRRSLSLLPDGATIVLNADDPSVAGLAEAFAGRVLYYGIDDPGAGASGEEHAADARWCHSCGAEYVYAPTYFGHIGLWRCPGCGRRRPDPDVQVTSVLQQGGALRLAVAVKGAATASTQEVALDVPLEGLYNAYNAAAAFAGALALGIAAEAVTAALPSFSAAFGRQERVQVEGRDVQMLLCKNPAGMNQALTTLLAASGQLSLLVALNDGTQDGRDISWIWDVDFERLAGRTASAVVTGVRATDMALRLKYAGLEAQLALERSQERALALAIERTPPGGRLSVLPTYTAMMSLRALIARRGGSAAFWQQ